MDSSYWRLKVNNLECRLRAASLRIAAFESGDAYISLRESDQKVIRDYQNDIQKLKHDLGEAHKETIHVRNIWLNTLEDMEKEHQKELCSLKKKLEQMENRALAAEAARDKAKDDLTEMRRKYYDTTAELEEEKGRNLKLRAQINRDYENSSIQSSKSVNRKKISNSRERSGKIRAGSPVTRIIRASGRPLQKFYIWTRPKKSGKILISNRLEKKS